MSRLSRSWTALALAAALLAASPLSAQDVPCGAPDADPWVNELRDRTVRFNSLAMAALERLGPAETCRGAVTSEFDGAKFGRIALSLPPDVTLSVETMPPEISIVELRSASRLADPGWALEALTAYAAGIGLDLDWATATETLEADERVVTAWDPLAGLNGSAARVYRGGVLVGVRLSLAP